MPFDGRCRMFRWSRWRWSNGPKMTKEQYEVLEEKLETIGKAIDKLSKKILVERASLQGLQEQFDSIKEQLKDYVPDNDK